MRKFYHDVIKAELPRPPAVNPNDTGLSYIAEEEDPDEDTGSA